MGRRRRQYRKGRWEVQRERCRLADPAPPSPSCDASPLGTFIPQLMKRLGLAEQHWVGRLEEAWPGLVGDAVAGHTRPGRLEHGVLVVFVDSSVWLSELSRYGRGEMLASVRRRFGSRKISNIRLQLDPGDRGGAGRR